MLEASRHEDPAPSQQALLARIQRIGGENIRDADIAKLGRVIGDNLPFSLGTTEELQIALGTERLDAAARQQVSRILDDIAERVALETGDTFPHLKVPPVVRKPEKPN